MTISKIKLKKYLKILVLKPKYINIYLIGFNHHNLFNPIYISNKL